jgi:hypothetical protein
MNHFMLEFFCSDKVTDVFSSYYTIVCIASFQFNYIHIQWIIHERGSREFLTTKCDSSLSFDWDNPVVSTLKVEFKFSIIRSICIIQLLNLRPLSLQHKMKTRIVDIMSYFGFFSRKKKSTISLFLLDKNNAASHGIISMKDISVLWFYHFTLKQHQWPTRNIIR